MKPITAIVLGAGQRGANVYAAYALSFPNELKIVGVAEPRAGSPRRICQGASAFPKADKCFAGWEDCAQHRIRFADCVFVCTQDRMHFAAGHAGAGKGL